MPEAEVYSNPIAPSHEQYMEDDDSDKSQVKLTNDDFRKLLMTPRAPSTNVAHQEALFSKPKHVTPNQTDLANLKKKKKSYYIQMKKEEDEREKELAQKYRDRAKERREGSSTSDPLVDMSTTINYRAVAPDAQRGADYAERRKQVIEESKYLGGDMEHTHLVKGLDYSLLEKVKAEIANKAQEEEIEKVVPQEKTEKEIGEKIEDYKYKTTNNLMKLVEKMQSTRIEKLENFAPGRMAYVVQLDDNDENFFEIPTTLMRSKMDYLNNENLTTLSNNDIVINKLTQILSYLRQGYNKKKKKDKPKVDEIPLPPTNPVEENIFETEPKEKSRHKQEKQSSSSSSSSRHHHHRHHSEGDKRREERGRRRDKDEERKERGEERRGGRRSYFEKSIDEKMFEENSGPKISARDFVRNVNERLGKSYNNEENKETKKDDKMKKMKSTMNIDSYAECYPGMMESADALGDSDDEADYTKMDQGNKKGPVGRWDFENQDEYNSYMSSKEALPKAAFQYGVKMADGRKTRRVFPKDEKKELDKEWNKIQGIIAKRKPEEAGFSGLKQPKLG